MSDNYRPFEPPSELRREDVRFGDYRFPLGREHSREKRIKHSIGMLARCLNSRTLVAVVGARCSADSCYGSWHSLVRELISQAATKAESENQHHESIPILRHALTCREELSTGGLTYVTGLCQDILGAEFNKFYKTRFCLQRPHRPSQTTEQLLKLPINRFITTNYDCQLEFELNRCRDVAWDHFGIDLPFSLSEYGIQSELHAKDESIHIGRRRAQARSFTQAAENANQLAMFSLARVPQAANMVFHCHGRFDQPETIIASERQYREFYVDPLDQDKRAFRQSVELLFDSNPILFVGYGLADEDLLRPLRLLRAGGQRRSHPVFALMWETNDSERMQNGYLSERFGLEVIPYACELSEALRKLRTCWLSWHRIWLEKPKFKQVSYSVSPPMFEFSSDDRVQLAAGKIEREVIALRQWLPRDRKAQDDEVDDPIKNYDGPFPSVIAIVGPGGTGKSHRVRKLFKCELEARTQAAKNGSIWKDRNRRCFFWSSYYSDDLLSGIDQLLDCLEKDREVKAKGRFRRLEDCLRGHHLIIVDGFERLLRTNLKQPDLGDSFSQTVSRFLKLFTSPGAGQPCDTGDQLRAKKGHRSDPEMNSILLITSRLWPADLQAPEPEKDGKRTWENVEKTFAELRRDNRHTNRNGDRINKARGKEASEPVQNQDSVKDVEAPHVPAGSVVRIDSSPLEPSDLDGEAFPGLLPDQKDELCSLVSGHSYALVLADAMLQARGGDGKNELLTELLHRLAETPDDRRVSRMIREAVEDLEPEGSEAQDLFSKPLLTRMATFMSPLKFESLKTCFGEVLTEKLGPDWGLQSNSQSVLTDLLEIALEDLVQRRLVFRHGQRMEESLSASYVVHPTVRSYLFQQTHRVERAHLPNFTLAGLTSATAAVDPGSEKNAERIRKLFGALANAFDDPKNDDAARRRLCRSLFALVRARMESNTATRWSDYDRYSEFAMQVLNRVRQVSPNDCWRYSSRPQESENAALYADELAFLYNDLGLTLCAQGYMLDASAVWEQGLQINRLLEGESEVPIYRLQSELHMAHTFIELGRLEVAQNYLDDCRRTNSLVCDRDYEGRVEGYQALIEHLKGNLEKAEQIYSGALRMLEDTRNDRARAFFFRHRAELAIGNQRYSEAQRYINTCYALSKSSRNEDLVAYSRMTQGSLLRARNRLEESWKEYDVSLKLSRKWRIPRLESEVLSGMSRLALRLGDTVLARQHAMAALALANELGLGLRQTHALVVLGRASIGAGMIELGKSYLLHAKALGEQQHYFLRTAEADRELEKFGIPAQKISTQALPH